MSLSVSMPIPFQMSDFFILSLYNVCRLSYKALFFSTLWMMSHSPVSSMLVEDHVFVTSGINILWLADAFSHLGWGGGGNCSQTDFGKIVFGLGLVLVFVALCVTATILIALEWCQSFLVLIIVITSSETGPFVRRWRNSCPGPREPQRIMTSFTQHVPCRNPYAWMCCIVDFSVCMCICSTVILC